jgi:putative intracellular protease/amidase
MKKERILFVVTSNDKMGAAGKPTGAYLPEIAHPYEVLSKDYEIDFTSPIGGTIPLIGIDKSDKSNVSFLENEVAMNKLMNSMKPEDINAAEYAAIFYAGGHGTMWDFPDNESLQKKAAEIYEMGGVIGAVCHGPAGLVNIRLSNGQYLLKGKNVAGFTNEEESAAGLEKTVPFFLADKMKEAGASHSGAGVWEKHVVADGRLVTGQNPASAYGVAEEILKKLKTGSTVI